MTEDPILTGYIIREKRKSGTLSLTPCPRKDVAEVKFENDNYLLSEAIQFAAFWHRDAVRKGTDMPYIVHPMEVMHNLYLMGADKKLMAAGVLHDVVEDTEVTIEMVREVFGDEVALLVNSHTEQNKELPWEERKIIAMEEERTLPKNMQMLALADKLSNIRAMARDYKACGEELWKRFNRGKDKQSWYYHSSANVLSALGKYDDTALAYVEFCNLVDEVFGSEPEGCLNKSC